MHAASTKKKKRMLMNTLPDTILYFLAVLIQVRG